MEDGFFYSASHSRKGLGSIQTTQLLVDAAPASNGLKIAVLGCNVFLAGEGVLALECFQSCINQL